MSRPHDWMIFLRNGFAPTILNFPFRSFLEDFINIRMIRQGEQVLLNWLNLWLDQMFRDGHVQKLQAKWLGRVLE